MNIRRKNRERGSVALEYLGFLPVLLIIALAAIQLGIVAFTAQQAGTAARASARSAAQGGDFQSVGSESLSNWLQGNAEFLPERGGESVTVTARVKIPSLFPGLFDETVEKSATMPRDSQRD
ncbi:TadE family protein [Streptomyces sp. NPDC050504]|uniref:TadE family protein n=1 Tax=Streptomyces sp. NPDC050504 TaxID=3365618 RepID=UPI0037B59029